MWELTLWLGGGKFSTGDFFYGGNSPERALLAGEVSGGEVSRGTGDREIILKGNFYTGGRHAYTASNTSPHFFTHAFRFPNILLVDYQLLSDIVNNSLSFIPYLFLSCDHYMFFDNYLD